MNCNHLHGNAGSRGVFTGIASAERGTRKTNDYIYQGATLVAALLLILSAAV